MNAIESMTRSVTILKLVSELHKQWTHFSPMIDGGRYLPICSVVEDSFLYKGKLNFQISLDVAP